jgi:tetratricopeptide (TPR) repeat protein
VLGQEQQAIADFSQVIKLAPDHLYAYHWRAYIHLKQKNYQEAIADYSTIIERLDPTYFDAYHGRGNAYYAQEEYALAVEDYSHMIQLQPDNALGYYSRGLAYSQWEKPDQAISDFKRALVLDPEHTNTHRALGNIYFGRADYQDALPHYSRYLALTTAPEGLLEVRMMLHRLGIEGLGSGSSAAFEDRLPVALKMIWCVFQEARLPD